MSRRFTLPADVDWRIRNMDRICAWLRANGVEPARVPLDGSVWYFDRHLTYDEYAYTDGRLTADLVTGEIPRLIQLTRLAYRWGDARPLPIDGNAYRRRVNRRRKKR